MQSQEFTHREPSPGQWVEAVLAHFATDGQLQSNGSTGALGRDGLVHADQNLPLHCIIELNGTTSINLH